MPSGDRELGRLRAAVDQFAAADVSQLIEEARAEARNRARSLLGDALTDSLLAQALKELEPRDADTATEDTGDSRSPRPAGQPAWYVYGIINAGAEMVARGLRGIGDGPLATVTEGQLTAVYSRVPREDFEETELRTHLSDMAWVEHVARGHEAALDELCSQTTVIPMRMCTVYQTESRLREMLQREREPLTEAIEHLEGKREWGVQAFLHRDRASLSVGGDECSGSPGGSSGSAGAAYMQRRRRERDSEVQLERLVAEAAEEIHDSLAAAAVDSALNSPQRPEATGRRAEMVLNGVYLVEDQAKEAFDDRVRELQSNFSSTGLELLVTGPWPPYNFLPGSIGAAW
jgi:hypothetical protein